MSRFSLAFSIFLISIITRAQSTSDGQGSKALSPAVQFLEVAPDSRSAGMGNTGAATSPDIYSMYWNPAKLALLDEEYGASISYTPWLKQLVNDMWIGYLNGYMKLSKEDALGVSLQYFDLGKLELRDDQGNPQGDYNPREMALALTYSRVLTRELSVAGSIKYINSNPNPLNNIIYKPNPNPNPKPKPHPNPQKKNKNYSREKKKKIVYIEIDILVCNYSHRIYFFFVNC